VIKVSANGELFRVHVSWPLQLTEVRSVICQMLVATGVEAMVTDDLQLWGQDATGCYFELPPDDAASKVTSQALARLDCCIGTTPPARAIRLLVLPQESKTAPESASTSEATSSSQQIPIDGPPMQLAQSHQAGMPAACTELPAAAPVNPGRSGTPQPLADGQTVQQLKGQKSAFRSSTLPVGASANFAAPVLKPVSDAAKSVLNWLQTPPGQSNADPSIATRHYSQP